MESFREIVCHITSAAPVFDGRVFERECRTLAANGYDVRLIARHDRTDIVHGVTIVPLPLVNFRPIRMLLLPIMAFVHALRQRAGLYEIHDPELIPVGLLLKLLGKTVIYTVQEDHARNAHFKPYLPRWIRRVGSRLVAEGERLIAARADAVMPVTEDIAALFPHARRVVLVRNYPVIEYGPLFTARTRTRTTPTVVLYAGELSPIRGLPQLLQAMVLLRTRGDYRLRLAGPFSSHAFEAALREQPGFADVEYLGVVPRTAVSTLMLDADVGIVCLLPERHFVTSLPLKMFEYMAAGLPMVASAFADWLPLVRGTGAGVCVDPCRPEQIADAIERLATDRQFAASCSEAGRRAVRDRFNWERESQRLLALYKDLLAPSSTARAADGGTRWNRSHPGAT